MLGAQVTRQSRRARHRTADETAGGGCVLPPGGARHKLSFADVAPGVAGCRQRQPRQARQSLHSASANSSVCNGPGGVAGCRVAPAFQKRPDSSPRGLLLLIKFTSSDHGSGMNQSSVTHAKRTTYKIIIFMILSKTARQIVTTLSRL